GRRGTRFGAARGGKKKRRGGARRNGTAGVLPKAGARAAPPPRSGVDGHAEPVSGPVLRIWPVASPTTGWPCIYCLKASTPVMNIVGIHPLMAEMRERVQRGTDGSAVPWRWRDVAFVV